MKILLLLLALGLCFADSVPAGYQQIDTTEAQADPTIQSYIQDGLDAVVQHAINNGYLSNSNSDFTLAQINSVYEQVANGENYKFDCNFTDSEGINIRANFTVSHSNSSNTTIVSSFVYKIHYPPVTTVITTVTSSAPSNTTNTTVSTQPEGSVVSGESVNMLIVDEEALPIAEEATVVAEEAATVAPAEEAVTVALEEASVETTVAPAEEAVTVAPEEAAVESPVEAPQEAAVESTPQNTTSTATEATPAPTVSADGFTAINLTDFAQDQDLQKLFAFGFQNIVQNGIQANKIPNTTFSTAQVSSVSQKTVNNGERYKFTAEASNGSNVQLNLTFEVVQQVPTYSYQVKITTAIPSNNTGSNNTGSNNNTTTPPPATGGSGNNSTAPSNNTSPSNNTAPSNNTGSNGNGNTNPTSGDWVNVDLSQVQQNAEINSSLVDGFNQVIQAVVQKNKLKADKYTITQVTAASYHNLTNGVNYKFTVQAQNAAGNVFLNVNYTTYYRYSNQSVKTVAYQFSYYTTSTPVAPAPPAQNNTNTTVPTNSTNTTVPANNTNGYVALSNDQIQAQDVQSALKYGADQIVQMGKQQGKIPSGTYKLVQVASVFKKIQPSGANYNCTVTLQGAANVTVNANFNVFSNPTSNTMILQAYSYGVTGIKKN